MDYTKYMSTLYFVLKTIKDRTPVQVNQDDYRKVIPLKKSIRHRKGQALIKILKNQEVLS